MSKRSYRQNCALARASDVIGERWTLLLVRDLLVAPRRFNELLASAKGMGSNLLATRLKELERSGMIERIPGHGRSHRYALTERGRALEPAVLALIRWGLNFGPPNEPDAHHRHDWDLLALKALFHPARVSGLSISAQFRSDAMAGWVQIRDGEMRCGLGNLDAPDLVIDGTVADLFIGAADPAALLVTGSASELQRFMAGFALRT